MKRNVLIFLAAMAFPLMALATSPLGEPISTADFFQSIQGDYTIVKAGGTTPDVNDTAGSVEVEAASTRFTFPYCIPNGACFLGITNFKHPQTQVFRATSSDTEIYTIVSGQNQYQWEVSAGKIIYRNMQFHVSQTQTIVLEMELKKASE